MVSYYCLSLILQVVLILFNIPDIICNEHSSSSPKSGSHGRGSGGRYYSRSSGIWKILDYALNGDSERSTKFSTPEECVRPCKRGAAPKTCHYRWTLEAYHTKGGACNLYSPTTNTSMTKNCQCILADGTDRSSLLTANRQLPGPTIEVCIGDLVVVDVINRMPGQAVTIHWHGIYQMNHQYYDGVPHVTQCPISPMTSFRYQWAAQNAGTHFWHAHSGFHDSEGLAGAIVIHMKDEDEVSRNLYDHDRFDYHFFIGDWQHDSLMEHIPGTTYRNVGQSPDNFLINGRGDWLNPKTGKRTETPLTEFLVEKNQRYRIRMINACALVCPVEVRIEKHRATIITMDGSDVRPRTVDTITSFSAERYDFVLDTNQPVGTYWIQVKGIGACAERKIVQVAILRYTNSKHKRPTSERPSYDNPLPRGVVMNPLNEICDVTDSNLVCVKDLRCAEPLAKGVYDSKPDMSVLLSFGFERYDTEDLYGSHTYQRFVDPISNMSIAAIVAGISYSHSSSPLISQFNDIPEDELCYYSDERPEHCKHTKVCHCTQIIRVPLGSMVEMILLDKSGMGLSHPFHLHGYGFHVMGVGKTSMNNITEHNKEHALKRHREAYPSNNDRPPVKDTIAIPAGSYVIARFMADNPGWWLLHCHFVTHYYNGMSVVFKVGEDSDLPPIPEHFPTCGNFIPKVYKTDPEPRGGLSDLRNIVSSVKLPDTSSLLATVP